MNPVVVIPSYWADDENGAGPARYDHATALDARSPELASCLASLVQVRDMCRVVILAVCPLAQTEEVRRRIGEIVARYPELSCVVVTNAEAARIMGRIEEIAPDVSGETVSLRGYGAIRNMGLAVAAILGHDAVVFLDDDEVVLGEDFLELALHGLAQQTRQGLPILAKSGYFYDRSGSPYARRDKVRWCDRWWTKRQEFNEWMRHALSTTRISRSNYACGGLMALHARAYTRVAFDPYITRGEDLDYLFNLRMFGFDMWFDNAWAVRHLPPARVAHAPRFMQDVYRWYYEQAKIAESNGRQDTHQVTAASLMPYPGRWLSPELEVRVGKTSLARALATSEHAAYFRIWRRGRDEARAYAQENAGSYLRFQNFWATIMNGLWRDADLARMLLGE